MSGLEGRAGGGALPVGGIGRVAGVHHHPGTHARETSRTGNEGATGVFRPPAFINTLSQICNKISRSNRTLLTDAACLRRHPFHECAAEYRGMRPHMRSLVAIASPRTPLKSLMLKRTGPSHSRPAGNTGGAAFLLPPGGAAQYRPPPQTTLPDHSTCQQLCSD